ncbi:ribosome maturation factor RimP [Corynebacterium sp. ES2730-CONJ]|uniref:ribosome maturation factor RimP n=1 Tax=Corynebacterium sp. ES2730-CONJ TaxID=2973941 RepID=UPI00216B0E90|nr:ribosome maturation factor RimP [Corynebacterium sp. ES2730-CONJ]MCS4531184.1 ribosome maturation factor RimP [Corynebacterium sp. ES2730-CONJ]
MAFPSKETLLITLEPLASQYGVDIEDIRIALAGKKTTVAIAIDSDEHPHSDQLEALSLEISALFDAEEEARRLNFGAGYTLEVGTPGLDLPLTLPRHWRRARGRLVTVVVHDKKERFRVGPLNEDHTHVVLISSTKGIARAAAFEIEQILHAHQEVEFSDAPQSELELVSMSFDELATV